ncbi:MAG: flagellar basal-body MS-ring/collar protein FliF [Sulfurimicrobium sp.]|nr:flagellar basal-body MS-ring/collar protein FliF [Sulfurimicrobium sp.]MDP2200371.1 flagellar basal-body MS-ring/collar protein FliF [Sulfurimicrobium sp.]MDP3688222.1 flagellar basal-body MS-ring/collar protein FliF [Sulfurimicrobium sp.]MDZ7654622.1 flagellar basal-body MS-ring/collar protein FliF [Sulfurimicrobium sp.]
MSNQQKLGLMFAVAALIALLSGSWMWSQTPDYRVLYSNLSDRDGGTIISSLQQMNVPYKMAEGGGAILVPANQVYEMRLRLASQGLPKGSVVGFELMDGQKLGMSEFQERVNYQRALEGEITRSIQSLSAVQGARLHLAIPRPSVFIREQQKPSASVLLSLYPGRSLDAAQVSGIAHLISSSVPDLPLKNVTVVDQNGNLLTGAGEGAGAHAGLDPTQLDYLHQVEQSYVKRIESILMPILGQGNIKAQVAADLDFSMVEQTAETYKPNPVPNEAAIRSQQMSETSGDAGKQASGVPGALSNQPPGAASAPITATAPGAGGAAGTAAGGGNVHKESTVNFEVDKTIQHIRQPVGGIKRLSVAVVVNHRKDAKGANKPLTQAELSQIENLVKEAMGFSPTRGDTLNVVNAAFTESEAEEIPAVPLWKEPGNMALVKEVAKNLLIAALLFYLVFGVIRPILRDLARPHAHAGVAGAEEEDVAEISPEALAKASQAAGYEENLKAAKELAKQDPRVVASVVKDWVGAE